jgi:hypothetical protein
MLNKPDRPQEQLSFLRLCFGTARVKNVKTNRVMPATSWRLQ